MVLQVWSRLLGPGERLLPVCRWRYNTGFNSSEIGSLDCSLTAGNLAVLHIIKLLPYYLVGQRQFSDIDIMRSVIKDAGNLGNIPNLSDNCTAGIWYMVCNNTDIDQQIEYIVDCYSATNINQIMKSGKIYFHSIIRKEWPRQIINI